MSGTLTFFDSLGEILIQLVVLDDIDNEVEVWGVVCTFPFLFFSLWPGERERY